MKDDKETAHVLLDNLNSVDIEENDRDLLYSGRFFNGFEGEAYFPHNYNGIVVESTAEDFEICEQEVLGFLKKTD